MSSGLVGIENTTSELVMKGPLTVEYNVQTRASDNFVESMAFRNVWDDENGKPSIGVRLADLQCLVLRPDSSNHLVSSLNEKAKDVRWRIATVSE